MNTELHGTHQKALRVNLDPGTYGTFAEIGAGQEVARWFFRVGGAAGTIAKTMSAYDMAVSDAIYGKADRYVSRQRLSRMLDHEFALLGQRLGEKRGATTRFFVFADTVVAKSFKGSGECHGWMGVRFQTKPQAAPSEILVHVRLSDRENLTQQEALGIFSRQVLACIRTGNPSWEDAVPPRVAELIKERKLFQYLPPEALNTSAAEAAGPTASS